MNGMQRLTVWFRHTHPIRFDLKKTLEMDPEFLDIDGEHVHDDSVTTLSIVRDGDVHNQLVNEWVNEVLRDFGASIYRMKGVLAIKGAPDKFVYQAVHMIFNVGHCTVHALLPTTTNETERQRDRETSYRLHCRL